MCISSRQLRALGWDQVVARRLERSSLDRRAPRGRLLEVVRETCGVHAQLASGAELAISARVDDVTFGDVQDALWRSRGSWSRRRPFAGRCTCTRRTTSRCGRRSAPSARAGGEQFWLDWQGLTLVEAEQLRESVLDVLADGEPRTRVEIGAAVGGRLGEHLAGDSWGHYLAPAADRLCHGPPSGRRVTFVRCDRLGARLARGRPARGRGRSVPTAPRRLRTGARDELEHWLSQRLLDDVFAELDARARGGRRRRPPRVRASPARHSRTRRRAACGCSATTTST